MTATAAAVGHALAASADEALRLWRAARRHARPNVFPGLLDGLVGGFAPAVGETLARRQPPEAAWAALGGVVRLPHSGVAEELEAEWALAGEVASAIADAVKAGPEARHQAIAAARYCWERTRELAELAGPSRGPVLVVKVLGGAPAGR